MKEFISYGHLVISCIQLEIALDRYKAETEQPLYTDKVYQETNRMLYQLKNRMYNFSG